MGKCKFLKQKKQVQINGEWVDTRSYRYILYCDGSIPCVTIKGDPNILYHIFYCNINNPYTEYCKEIRLDSSGNGYIEFESDDSIYKIQPYTVSSLLFKAEIKGCNVSGFAGLELNTLTVSCSTYCRPNLDRVFYNNSPNLRHLIFKGFDTSNATTMSSMFENCSGLTSLDVRNFNTSKVTSMNSMFGGCSGLTSLDVSSFDTSNVTDMGKMFYGCSGLTSLDVSSFDTSNVTDMNHMFYRCRKLTTLDVGNFNTSNVTNMLGMFDGCTGLTSLDLSHFNTSNVVEMSEMFYDCEALTSLDLSNFDTSNVTQIPQMFHYCYNLQTLDLSGWDLTNLRVIGGWPPTKGLFTYCESLNLIYMRGCNQNTIDKIKSALDSAGILDQVTIIT